MLIRTIMSIMVALFFTATASAQSYPKSPVTIIVPFAPGGSVDIVGRLAAAALQEKLGQPFVVDYRQGANSQIGSAYVAKAKPDGYTMLLFSGSLMVNVSTQKNLSYDTIKDFTPVGMLGENANVLVVSPKLGVSTVKELIALAKTRKDGLKYGSSGIGGPLHLAAELFKNAANINMVHVPYKGTGAMFPDVMSGNVDMAVVSIPSGIGFIKSGQLKAVAVTGAQRAANLPDVPTMKESGLDLVTAVPYGLVAPAGTPPDVIKRLNDALKEILASQSIKERFAAGEIDPIYATPEKTGEFIRTEIARYADIVKKAGIQPE